MTSADDQLDSLRARVHEFERSRGFGDAHTPRALVTAVAVEAGELLAEVTWLGDERDLASSKVQCLGDEMADVFIYLLHLERVLGIDLVELAQRKMDSNEVRYPPAT